MMNMKPILPLVVHCLHVLASNSTESTRKQHPSEVSCPQPGQKLRTFTPAAMATSSMQIPEFAQRTEKPMPRHNPPDSELQLIATIAKTPVFNAAMS